MRIQKASKDDEVHLALIILKVRPWFIVSKKLASLNEGADLQEFVILYNFPMRFSRLFISNLEILIIVSRLDRYLLRD